jgi:gamma-glutamyltranspeptidase/glutathione hydrolase
MRPIVVVLALLLGGCSLLPGPFAPAGRAAADAPRAPGMVSAANPLAVEAGLRVLREGGTAADAAVAVQAVLGLVEPRAAAWAAAPS